MCRKVPDAIGLDLFGADDPSGIATHDNALVRTGHARRTGTCDFSDGDI